MESKNNSDTASALTGELVVLVVVVVLLTIWLMMKLYELVIRQLIAHPKCWILWLFTIAHAVVSLLVMTSTSWNTALYSWYTTSIVALWMVAKIVELYYTEMAEKDVTYQSVKQSLFHEPWWNVKS